MFFRDFVLLFWLEIKDRNSGQGWASLGPSWLCVEFQPAGFTVKCWCYSQATFEEGKEERVFGQRTVWSKGHGNHTGQDETRGIICFFFFLFICFFTLSVRWHFYFWEQVHGDSQRHWWFSWHLMLLVIISLCTHPWVQSIFSLVITQVLPSWEGWHGSFC